MAIIKSFTDIEQSKKLAEILPIESADMYWSFGNIKFMDDDYDSNVVQNIPCWSLAALLDIVRKLVGYSLHSFDTKTVFMECELGEKPYDIETNTYGNPVDAAFEMVMHLHELNLL